MNQLNIINANPSIINNHPSLPTKDIQVVVKTLPK